MLLNYELRSDPSPLTASPLSGDPLVGDLLLVVSLPPPGVSGTIQPVQCDRIAIQFSRGDGEGDLIKAADVESLHVGFTSEGWTATLTSGATTCTATLTADNAVFDAKTAVAFKLSGVRVSPLVGVAPLRVAEFSAPADSGKDPERHEMELFVAKFPHAYVFRDFASDDAMVEYGQATVLHWTGEAGEYTLSVNGGSPRVLTTEEVARRTVITPSLQQTSVFTLTVTAGSPPARVSASLRAMVMVSRPWAQVTGLLVEREGEDGKPADGFMRVRGQATFQTGLDLEMEVPAACDPSDTGSFRGRTLPRNTLGWFMSDDTGQLESWLMGASAVRLAVNGVEGLSLDGQSRVRLPRVAARDQRAVAALYIDCATGEVLQGPQSGSAEALKQDIQPMCADFQALLQARPVEFTYRHSGEQSFGYIAEELAEKGLEHLVHRDGQGKAVDVAYDKLAVWLLEILRDQQRRIEMLERGQT